MLAHASLGLDGPLGPPACLNMFARACERAVSRQESWRSTLDRVPTRET